MMSSLRLAGGVLVMVLMGLLPEVAWAQSDGVPTRVRVRAVSQDAKVLHDGVGGARITIRDAATGAVLAQGVQEGSSGSTEAIMETPRTRGATVYDTPGTAAYEATLLLERPTVVEVSAEGPLGSPQAMQQASKTLLLVPGRDVLGEGILLTIHGFIVDLLRPASERVVAPSSELPVRARVRMSCGCPTEPGGLWDADDFDIVARLVRDGAVLHEVPLHYAGEQSTYEGTLPLNEAEAEGTVLEVLAMDPEHANFGMARRALKPGTPEGQ